MNILIVDDSAPVRRMIHKLVAPLASEMFECVDGDDAVAAYALNRPDWVLMDIRLGRLDGITATRQICQSNPEAKVVIVTSYDDPGLRAAAFEAGACEYILKDDLYKLPEVLRTPRTVRTLQTNSTRVDSIIGD